MGRHELATAHCSRGLKKKGLLHCYHDRGGALNGAHDHPRPHRFLCVTPLAKARQTCMRHGGTGAQAKKVLAPNLLTPSWEPGGRQGQPQRSSRLSLLREKRAGSAPGRGGLWGQEAKNTDTARPLQRGRGCGIRDCKISAFCCWAAFLFQSWICLGSPLSLSAWHLPTSSVSALLTPTLAPLPVSWSEHLWGERREGKEEHNWGGNLRKNVAFELGLWDRVRF